MNPVPTPDPTDPSDIHRRIVNLTRNRGEAVSYLGEAYLRVLRLAQARMARERTLLASVVHPDPEAEAQAFHKTFQEAREDLRWAKRRVDFIEGRIGHFGRLFLVCTQSMKDNRPS